MLLIKVRTTPEERNDGEVELEFTRISSSKSTLLNVFAQRVSRADDFGQH